MTEYNNGKGWYINPIIDSKKKSLFKDIMIEWYKNEVEKELMIESSMETKG